MLLIQQLMLSFHTENITGQTVFTENTVVCLYL